MILTPTRIPDVILIKPSVFEDERGWFMESFNEHQFHQSLKAAQLPIPKPFVQDNHSCSKKNVLRGLHYQCQPYAQGKLVRVTKGAAYDVVVDLRAYAPTFGKAFGIELNDRNKYQLWIPEGFAHGFLALTENTEFLYKTTQVYNKHAERSILWNDSALEINWPLHQAPILNEKDKLAPLFADAIPFIREAECA